MADYNGWTNRSTWLVNLHIDNDYGVYMQKVELLREIHVPISAIRARNMLGPLLAQTNARNEGYRARDVNWDEIAESLEAERLDIHQHEDIAPNYSARLDADGMF